MSTPTDITWSMDDHTRAKHIILRRYLDAWLPIMTTFNERVLIIDGFAGPGEYKDGEIGSPLIMIDAFLNHSYTPIQRKEVTFFFIEENAKRYEHLKQLLERRKKERIFPPKASYHVFQGTFKGVLTELLKYLEDERLTMAPTFAFIDPFGYSYTPMSIIQGLMRHPKCEVLITFMYEEINRFLTADYSTKEHHYDELFGTTEWRRIAADLSDSKERRHQQHDLYRDQLINVGGAKYVRSFRMRNKRNTTDYFLFFGTKSLSGLEAMKKAMWRVDSTGGYDFSDYTNPNQPLLFSQPNYTELQLLLVSKFKGKTVRIEEIEEYVIAETPFYKYKTEVLKPMEQALVPEIEVISSNPKRKRGTFADGKTRIRFL